MKAVDKFGNPIYTKTFQKMEGFARVLRKHRYIESKRKLNLFYKKEEQLIFFADMRGTDIVPIWEDPHPLFYVKFLSNKIPKWKRNRIAQEEFYNLIICRESYDPDLTEYSLQGDNGYCLVCGKDFQGDGSFCSRLCEEVYEDLAKAHCQVCGKSFPVNRLVEHHLSYKEDKTISVCRSCHLKIHRGTKLPKLKPVDIK